MSARISMAGSKPPVGYEGAPNAREGRKSFVILKRWERAHHKSFRSRKRAVERHACRLGRPFSWRAMAAERDWFKHLGWNPALMRAYP
jgi:hypothetical protein